MNFLTTLAISVVSTVRPMVGDLITVDWRLSALLGGAAPLGGVKSSEFASSAVHRKQGHTYAAAGDFLHLAEHADDNHYSERPSNDERGRSAPHPTHPSFGAALEINRGN